MKTSLSKVAKNFEGKFLKTDQTLKITDFYRHPSKVTGVD